MICFQFKQKSCIYQRIFFFSQAAITQLSQGETGGGQWSQGTTLGLAEACQLPPHKPGTVSKPGVWKAFKNRNRNSAFHLSPAAVSRRGFTRGGVAI